jgi:hypothetical protein
MWLENWTLTRSDGAISLYARDLPPGARRGRASRLSSLDRIDQWVGHNTPSIPHAPHKTITYATFVPAYTSSQHVQSRSDTKRRIDVLDYCNPRWCSALPSHHRRRRTSRPLPRPQNIPTRNKSYSPRRRTRNRKKSKGNNVPPFQN